MSCVNHYISTAEHKRTQEALSEHMQCLDVSGVRHTAASAIQFSNTGVFSAFSQW